MSDITVILDKSTMTVRSEAKTIRMERPGCRPQRIPIAMTDQVIAIGNPMISCELLRELANKNIPVILLPARGPHHPTYVGAGLCGGVQLRIRQFKAWSDLKYALSIGRRLIASKINGQKEVLRQHQDHHPYIEKAATKLDEQIAKLGEADDRNTLMGYEGSAASIYFKALSAIIPKKWKFLNRNRNPPKDPVNSLLSFSYVLTAGEVRRSIQTRGIDPAVGFIHAPLPHRENFVLDILEPLRPYVDAFVLSLLDNPLTLKDFTINTQDGCRLNKNGRKAYFQAWSTWRDSVHNQKKLKHLAEAIIDDVIACFPE